jgi:tight adherence protein C
VILLANLLSMEGLVALAVFVTFAAAAWWLLDMLNTRQSRVQDRLDKWRRPPPRRSGLAPASTKRADAMAKVLEKAAPLAAPLQPKSEEELGKLRAKLMAAGFRNESAGSLFLAMKFAGLLLGVFLGAGAVLPFSGLSNRSLMSVVAVGGLMFYVPEVIIRLKGHSRTQKIFLGLPDALDLMVVCVEAGLGLDQAMRKVAEEMKRNHPVIAEEFAVSNFQLQVGRRKQDVLRELGARTNVADLRSLAGVLIQADKFGSSIAQALRVQSDSMRTRRRQMAEEKAAKTAVKLIFPLVLFIFPGIFVVLVGPAAIQMVRQMFPMMSGG